MLQTSFHFQSPPVGFWEDGYVLGYLHGSIAVLAKMSSRGKLSGGDLGIVARNVYESLAGGHGGITISHILKFASEKDDDFAVGMENEAKCVMVAYGDSGFEDDQDVKIAREIAIGTRITSASSEPLTTAEIAGALQFQLFNGMIRRRFG
jgi:hypothetical protein